MLTLTCICGRTYHADENHIGYSIRCTNEKCERIIRVVRADEPTSSPWETRRNEDVHIEPIPSSPTPSRPFHLNESLLSSRVLPTMGLIALVIGVTLTVVSFRARKAETRISNVTPEPSVRTVAASANPLTASRQVNGTVPSPSARLSSPTPIGKTQTATPAIDFSDVAKPSSTVNPPSPQEPAIGQVQQMSPTPTPETFRYANGTNLIRPTNLGGRGILRVSNGTSSDAIAKLVDTVTNKTRRLVYIRASSDATISNIAAGEYVLKFCLGTGYNPSVGKFLYSLTFERFDDTLDFREFETSDRARWSEFEVTLHPVIDGNAHTSSISASDFEDH